MIDGNEDHFNFEPVEELDENLDFKHLKLCPFCKKEVPQNAISCLYCGQFFSSARKPKWIIWVASLVIICFVLFLFKLFL